MNEAEYRRLFNEIARLRAENEKLKVALSRIADEHRMHEHDRESGCRQRGYLDGRQCVKEIADTALAESGEGEKDATS